MAERGFGDAIEALFNNGEIKEGFRLILGYVMAEKSEAGSVLSEKFLKKLIQRLMKEYSDLISKDEDIRKVVIQINRYVGLF
jgi:hypothetical protein